MHKVILKILLLLLLISENCLSGCRIANVNTPLADKITADHNNEPNCVDTILLQLQKKTSELKQYQCNVEYLVRQPSFETQTLRKGELYYQKTPGKSNLRVNFETVKEDEEKEEKQKVQYILDGIWLTHIDYEMKQVAMHQLTDANDPNAVIDAFELISRNFPIVGFSKTEDLKKQFEIKVLELEQSEAQKYIKLHLKVRPDSAYKDDYTAIEFWIDKKLYLPAKVVSVSTEEDIYQIKFLNVRVNKKLSAKTFDFEIPKGFTVEKNPIKKKAEEK